MTKRYDNHKNKEIKGVGNSEDEHCSNCFERTIKNKNMGLL
jgi:hypothetical protein